VPSAYSCCRPGRALGFRDQRAGAGAHPAAARRARRARCRSPSRAFLASPWARPSSLRAVRGRRRRHRRRGPGRQRRLRSGRLGLGGHRGRLLQDARRVRRCAERSQVAYAIAGAYGQTAGLAGGVAATVAVTVGGSSAAAACGGPDGTGAGTCSVQLGAQWFGAAAGVAVVTADPRRRHRGGAPGHFFGSGRRGAAGGGRGGCIHPAGQAALYPATRSRPCSTPTRAPRRWRPGTLRSRTTPAVLALRRRRLGAAVRARPEPAGPARWPWWASPAARRPVAAATAGGLLGSFVRRYALARRAAPPRRPTPPRWAGSVLSSSTRRLRGAHGQPRAPGLGLPGRRRAPAALCRAERSALRGRVRLRDLGTSELVNTAPLTGRGSHRDAVARWGVSSGPERTGRADAQTAAPRRDPAAVATTAGPRLHPGSGPGPAARARPPRRSLWPHGAFAATARLRRVVYRGAAGRRRRHSVASTGRRRARNAGGVPAR
jgi:hypothetical protein